MRFSRPTSSSRTWALEALTPSSRPSSVEPSPVESSRPDSWTSWVSSTSRVSRDFLTHDASSCAGILLFGPPGTGKTLMARQIGSMLNAREPKVVNGPEILNKFVGQSEENIRKLFADAEKEVSSLVHVAMLELTCSKRRRATKAACTSLFSMSWTLFANSVDRPTAARALATRSSTSFCPRYVYRSWRYCQ